MQQLLVESTALARVSYAAASQRLEVEFRDRTIYVYSGVPAKLYAALLAAESKGKGFGPASTSVVYLPIGASKARSEALQKLLRKLLIPRRALVG